MTSLFADHEELDTHLVAHFQPLVDLHGGRVVGVVAVARLALGGELLLPGGFLGALRSPADRRALFDGMHRRAVRFIADERARHPQLRAIVKLDGSGTAADDLCATVTGRIESAGLAPGDVLIEVVPQPFTAVDVALRDELRRLVDTGARLVASGVSMGDELGDVPVDGAVLGRRYVSRLGDGPVVVAEARRFVDDTHRAGRTVIVEGVETGAQLDMVRDLGCRVGLGHLFAVPQDASAVSGLLDASLLPFSGPRAVRGAAR